MKAMVLAAGYGKRLHPITRWIPKPMIPVFGVPIIELNLRQLREQGIQDIIINLHHLPLQIIQHLRDGDPLGLKITYSLEPSILGTAGGLKKVEKFLQEGPFFVINSDTYRIVDFHGLLRHHQLRGAVLTMLLQENPNLPSERALWVDERGDVVGFLDHFLPADKPSMRPTDFLGVQVMEPEVLSYIPPGQPWEMKRVYVGLLSSGRPIGGFLHHDHWLDLGNLDGYWRIHMDALDGEFPLDIPGHAQEPGIWIAEGAHVNPTARVNPPVFLGPGCRVGGGAQIGPYAVLGRESTVEKGAQVARSILWDEVRIQDHAVVENRLVSRQFHCALSK